MFDADDTPGYLFDAYRTALDKGLQQLNLTRIGAGENRMWQASSRFPRSSGFHVAIEADALQAVMSALGAWARLDAPPPATSFADIAVPSPDQPRPHVLFETGDPGVPEQICDSNGEVVLGLCKVCGAAEIELELTPVCPGPQTAPAAGLFD